MDDTTRCILFTTVATGIHLFTVITYIATGREDGASAVGAPRRFFETFGQPLARWQMDRDS